MKAMARDHGDGDSGNVYQVLAIYPLMSKRQPGSKPTWTDVKAKLLDFDRPGLLGLIQDLYAANKHNRLFLHTRFGLGMGNDVLEPYKKTIDRWLCPDVYTNQRESYPQAKRAISDYKKAVGDPAGLATRPMLELFRDEVDNAASTGAYRA